MRGLVLLNKHAGLTSRSCVNKMTRIFKTKKIGHVGTLDPGATGMLPMCVGGATKFARFIVDADKCYTVKMRFGIQTSTGDMQGKIINKSTSIFYSYSEVVSVLPFFHGLIEQTVPIFSAVRVNGKRLYEYARSNEEVILPSRVINIKSINVLDVCGSDVLMQVVCGKGTYIRSLVEDIAKKLGSLACVVDLHRDWVQPFENDIMLDIESIDHSSLISLNKVFASYPKIILSSKQKQSLVYGMPLSVEHADSDIVALYYDNDFFGMGQVVSNQLKSLRLVSFC